MESKNYEIVAKELNITVSQVETVLNYFKEGAQCLLLQDIVKARPII